jgi:hypothetical protein
VYVLLPRLTSNASDLCRRAEPYSSPQTPGATALPYGQP